MLVINIISHREVIVNERIRIHAKKVRKMCKKREKSHFPRVAS